MIEIISVTYNTPDLIERLIKSVRGFISDTIQIHVVDGSDSKYEYLFEHDKNIKITRFGYNVNHGAGMDYAIKQTKASHVLILDSDVRITKPGVLDVLQPYEKVDMYAAGQIVDVNESGVNGGDIKYVHPRFMFLNVERYKQFSPFVNCGAPCIYAMIDINKSGNDSLLINIPNICDYFTELGRGTVNRYGYNYFYNTHDTVRANILVRTSGRPNYFARCYESIMSQKNKNFNLIVSYDDDETFEYLSKYTIKNLVRVEKSQETFIPRFFEEYGRRRNPAPWNLYFNEMYKYVDDGLVMFLDDDDLFFSNKSLSIIAKTFKKNTGSMFWRVLFPGGRIIPNDFNWSNRKPVCCDISGIGFCFNTSNIKHALFDGYNLGDYVLATRLYNNTSNKIFLDNILTQVGRKVANGLGRRDDL